MTQLGYRIVVIGGGHAGVEAAWAAANLSPTGPDGPATVALVTMDPSKIGVMSCNPAIGGLAKGQLVREIDALGGVMGLATDATGIQFRVLNTSKGPAVHGPRAQCDKHAYAEAVQRMIGSRRAIDVIGGSVEEISVAAGRAVGVVVRGAGQHMVALDAAAVVLTTGTFMRALMHSGETKSEGGRFGEGSAVGISACLRGLGFELGRLKTGTPPRIRRGSVDWESLTPQWGDSPANAFSDLSGLGESGADACPSVATFPVLPQIECRQTQTTPEIHALIRANLHRAPMYSGQIESTGPRYCPSIEDKVVRFAERASHGVFLEPESLRDDWVYVNGVSTSLPPDVQDAIVRMMPGCARAEILRYGYAVEYDMVRPHQIFATGMTRSIAGLFLAGQINGTSGYEEAAAQGLVAGVNAARYANNEPEWTVGRDEGYIGVLMDDLVTKTPVEPYRMFTSRAEHRLMLRSDNAADRLTPVAERLGLLADSGLGAMRLERFARRKADLFRLSTELETIRYEGRTASVMLRAHDADPEKIAARICGERADLASIARSTWSTAVAEKRYNVYIERQKADVKRASEMESRAIPADVDYRGFTHLRNEARQALLKFRPATMGQASRLEGLTPADVTLLAVLVQRWRVANSRKAADDIGAA